MSEEAKFEEVPREGAALEEAAQPEIEAAAAEAPIPEVVSDATSRLQSISSKVDSLKESASESISKVTDSVKSVTESVTSYSSTNSGKVILMLVIGAAVALITAYLLYWLINRTVNNTTYYLLPKTSMPIICTQETKLDGSGIPNSFNGHRNSFCFWIYIYDINKYTGSRRHVFHRGVEGDDYLNASPFVYLDPNSNALHINFSTTGTDSASIWGSKDAATLFDPTYQNTTVTNNTYEYRTLAKTTNSTNSTGSSDTTSGVNNVITQNADAATDSATLAYLNAIRGITINYVPLQRWVHIGVVVNEDMNGGSISAYVDGQLQNNVNSQSQITINNPDIHVSTNSTGIQVINSIATVTQKNVQLTTNTVIYNPAGNSQLVPAINVGVGSSAAPETSPFAKSYTAAIASANLKPLVPSFNIVNIDLDHKGDIYIGGSLSSATGPGFSGLVSKIQFFNYDLNAQDVYNNYLKGPIDNLMAKVGLPPYGVRSPIYPLS
jgi:hypothetical protein